MHKTIVWASVAAAAAITSGCTKGADAAADPAKIEAAIRAEEAQWQKDYVAKDVNALAAHYADDAALGGPGDPLATTETDRATAKAGLDIIEACL